MKCQDPALTEKRKEIFEEQTGSLLSPLGWKLGEIKEVLRYQETQIRLCDCLPLLLTARDTHWKTVQRQSVFIKLRFTTDILCTVFLSI